MTKYSDATRIIQLVYVMMACKAETCREQVSDCSVIVKNNHTTTEHQLKLQKLEF
jgi:hypothetical protein